MVCRHAVPVKTSIMIYFSLATPAPPQPQPVGYLRGFNALSRSNPIRTPPWSLPTMPKVFVPTYPALVEREGQLVPVGRAALNAPHPSTAGVPVPAFGETLTGLRHGKPSSRLERSAPGSIGPPYFHSIFRDRCRHDRFPKLARAISIPGMR